MSDLISREAAIDAAMKDVSDKRTHDFNAGATRAANNIKTLPSAPTERIRGRWEIYVISMLAGEGWRCSECGFEGVPYWDFCPNCGADMRGEELDETD